MQALVDECIVVHGVGAWFPRRMEIATKKFAEQAVITLSGKVDMAASPHLQKAAAALYNKDKCRRLIIDFSGVPLIDTSGLATLLDILAMAKERSGQLVLVGLNERLRYLIDVNGLTAFFRIAGLLQDVSDR